MSVGGLIFSLSEKIVKGGIFWGQKKCPGGDPGKSEYGRLEIDNISFPQPI